MTTAPPPASFEILLVATPGLENALAGEARAAGFTGARKIPGGVTVAGNWPDVWRANLVLRGAGRVVARIGQFRALHLAQLDKRARRFDWKSVLRPDVPVRVEASCNASRIYHSGAAAERIARAIREELGAPVTEDASVIVKARIDDDLCVLSIDTSGEPLHKRGHKLEVAKAPMRETMAALILRAAGYVGRESVVDPMCGSGTFVIEAAEIAAGLAPGRSRAFAFESLATFDAVAWHEMREAAAKCRRTPPPGLRFEGRDRDPGAIRMSSANAERAGVADLCAFAEGDAADAAPPDCAPGLVIVNPPYGARIGDSAALVPTYRALGLALSSRFAGWRVALVTSDPALAKATGLPFLPPAPPILHGGLRVTLWRTGRLG